MFYLASCEVLVDALPNGSLRLESLKASMDQASVSRAQKQANPFFSKEVYLVVVSGN